MKKITRKIFNSYREIQKNLLDTKAIAEISKISKGYIPWNSMAIRPYPLSIIVNDILLNNRKTIVEFGSGISTLVFSSLYTLIDDLQVISVDNDKSWQVKIKGLMSEQQLSRTVFIEEEILDCQSEVGLITWYKGQNIERALADVEIDLLFVDAPVAGASGTQQFNRFLGLPFVAEKLGDEATIYLDDVHRKAEKQILDKWAEMFAFEKEVLSIARLGVLRKEGKNFQSY